MPQRQAIVANILTLTILAPAISTQFDIEIIVRMYASLIIVGALASLFVNIITDQQKKLQQLAITDPLTGLLNRLTLEDTITRTIQKSHRTLMPMSLVSIDIDHFKLINDKHGHDVGDTVIIKIAELLKNRCRQVDKVYRVGGEEFLVLLFDANLDNAKSFSKSVQEQLSKVEFGNALSPTISIGLADIDKEKTWDECLKLADENLYKAKNSGRNTIVG